MKKRNWFKKGLVAGIIVLFIGVGVQPVIADVSITAISKNEENCNCQPVSNLHLIVLERLSNRLDRLLNRLEVYTGIISILYKHKPEVTEKLKELSNEITILQESNNELKSVFEFDLKDIICDAIASIYFPLDDFQSYLILIMKKYPALEPILYPTILSLELILFPLWSLYYITLQCESPW